MRSRPHFWKFDCIVLCMLRRDVKTARHIDRSAQNANKILAALPKTSRDWLHMLEPVTLQAGMVLYEPDEAIEHVYFLNDALVSILSMNSDGWTVEIGLVGNEGMVGVPAILGGVTPYRAVVPIGGNALRIASPSVYVGFQR